MVLVWRKSLVTNTHFSCSNPCFFCLYLVSNLEICCSIKVTLPVSISLGVKLHIHFWRSFCNAIDCNCGSKPTRGGSKEIVYHLDIYSCGVNEIINWFGNMPVFTNNVFIKISAWASLNIQYKGTCRYLVCPLWNSNNHLLIVIF